MKPTKLIFLPGAAGNASFWQPASNLIKFEAKRVFIEWPGIAGVTPDPAIETVDDLVMKLSKNINEPSVLIAQSMGGMVAVKTAMQVLSTHPKLITHLVLCVTSAGINVSDIKPTDWREGYIKTNPTFAKYFVEFDEDLTEQIQSLDIPVLLIWGDKDPISPVTIGERLNALIKGSKLEIILGGEHNLANVFASEVAIKIETFLNKSTNS
ncbi:alpha/beta fold hydrolase [Marinicellulosiphila megalodicopiae]|uniref:alpha/beta fold hydrolase n=1 Tax=Marinicellulosiphila megalodicopiae TaxID=2724896 RepID=UPI003BAE16D4